MYIDPQCWDDRLWLPGERETARALLAFAALYGFGNAMQIVSDAWREQDPVGALRVGECYGAPDA